MGIEVIVHNQDIGEAWRVFKRAISKDGVLQSLKERAAFGHKKSVAIRAKVRKAERRRIKLNEKRRYYS